MIEILLSKGYISQIDDIDKDVIEKYNLYPKKSRNTRYVYICINKYINTALHRIILQRKLDRLILLSEQVDHIDGNGLNNCRNNIRLASSMDNLHNVAKRKNKCTSKYKGVSLYKGGPKWKAQIMYNYHNITIGYFYNELDAAIAYNEAAKIKFGEFAWLNDVTK